MGEQHRLSPVAEDFYVISLEDVGRHYVRGEGHS
jgi:hypothetical protein